VDFFLAPSFDGNSRTQGQEILSRITRVFEAAHSKNFMILNVAVLIQCQGLSDGQTNRRTPRRWLRRAKHSANARKNSLTRYRRYSSSVKAGGRRHCKRSADSLLWKLYDLLGLERVSQPASQPASAVTTGMNFTTPQGCNDYSIISTYSISEIIDSNFCWNNSNDYSKRRHRVQRKFHHSQFDQRHGDE